MPKTKKTNRLTAALLLAPALTLGALPAEAQKKATPLVTRSTLYEAQRQHRPKEVIRQAEVLIAQATKTKDFALLLEAEKIRWEQKQYLDPNEQTTSYQRLASLASLPWLSASDRAVLHIFTLRHYIDAYYDGRNDKHPQRATYDPIEPAEWPKEVYRSFYTKHVEELLKELPVLTASLKPYQALFAQDDQEVSSGRTLASELLYALSYPQPVMFPELKAKVVTALQDFGLEKLTPYTASFVDQQAVIARLDELDRCAKPVAIQAELEGFLGRWRQQPVLGNYLWWLHQAWPTQGLSLARWLERIDAEASPRLPKSQRERLQWWIRDQRSSSITFDAPEQLIGRKDFTLRLRVAYLAREASVSLYPAPKSYTPAQRSWSIERGAQPLWMQRIPLSLDSLGYLEQEQTVRLSLPEAGAYRLVVSSVPSAEARGKASWEEQVIEATDYLALEHETTRKTSFQWLEALTGKPLAGATFAACVKEGWDKPVKRLKDVTSDSWGRFDTDGAELFYLAGSRDPLLARSYGGRSSSEEVLAKQADPTSVVAFVTTDRPAYRPGQRVQFYGVLSRLFRQAERAEVVAGSRLTLKIYGTNSRLLHTEQVTTDAFGRFSLGYDLPPHELTGRYRIEVEAKEDELLTRSSFQVFEYKRQEGLLSLDTPQLPLRAGSKVSITGVLRTLSGSPIAGAKVSYSLQVRRRFWRFLDNRAEGWNSRDFAGEEVIVTDDAGHFTIPLSLPMLDADRDELFAGKRIAFPWHSYELTVRTTDTTGEVQEERLTLPADQAVARVSPELETFIDKQSTQALLSFKPGSWEDVSLLVHYSIRQGERILHSDTLSTEGTADLAKHLRQLPTGRYELHYRTSFSDSLEYAGTEAFYLFDSKHLSPLSDLRAPLLLSAGTGHYSVAERPAIYWSSCFDGAYVFYEVYSDEGPLAEGLLRSEAGKVSVLPIDLRGRKVLPETLYARLWTVRDGRFIEQSVQLTRTQPKKELTLVWESFRDRLTAGAQETWRLTLRKPDGSPAGGAAVAAWMYDSALDAFGKLDLWKPQLRLDPSRGGRYGAGYTSTLSSEEEGEAPLTSWYSRWAEEQNQGAFRGAAVPPASLLAEVQASQKQSEPYYAQPMALAMDTMEDASLLRGRSRLETVVVSTGVYGNRAARLLAGKVAGVNALAPVQLRTAFAENAFFLPKLTTNAEGQVSWSFTAPERLSRWRMMLLAHTKGLDHQTEVRTVETYRPFSIRPALPRFLSEGDSLGLVTEVRNESAEAQQGALMLELFDPKTDEILHREETSFAVPAGKSTAYTLPLSGFAGRDSVGVRVIARGEGASDGEQHLLAVRSARQRLTERIAFTRHIDGRDSLDLRALLPQDKTGAGTDGQLTLRATSHAASFALSALQGLATDPGASAFSLATALYAQTLVKALRDVPGMQAWAREHVEKMPRLDLVHHSTLSDTPWAKVSEEEAKAERELAQALLAKQPTLEADRLLRQLATLQDKDGRWAWYPGMQGNSYTTEAVLRLLLRLPAERLEEAHRLRLKELVGAGLRALERGVIRLHQRLVSKKELFVDPLQTGLDYLSLAKDAQQRKLFSPDPASKKAETYFLARLRREAHRLPLYQKPQAARLFLAIGDRKLADALAISLREHLIEDETGRFFASLQASPYSWLDKTLPTVVEALQLFRQLGDKDQADIEGMTRWVINQKRTTSWGNELVSAEAVHALLLGEATQLTRSFAHVVLTMPLRDGRQFTAAGHDVQTTLPLSELSPDKPQLTIEQEGRGVVWGSAVASYILPTEAVQTAGGKELRLKREVFVVRGEGAKEELLPLQEGYELRVGDRLRTHITIELDRSMDFLRLVDPRMGFAEPVRQVPGYAWGEGMGYYYEPKDQTTAFYLDHLVRGKYRLSYDQRVARAGVFRGGVTELVSCYAPEFGAHTAVAPTQTVLPLAGK